MKIAANYILPSSAQLATQSRQLGWLVLLSQYPPPVTGRQAGQVLSSQDRAMSSNTKLFLSMSKHRKYFQTLTLLVMRPI